MRTERGAQKFTLIDNKRDFHLKILEMRCERSWLSTFIVFMNRAGFPKSLMSVKNLIESEILRKFKAIMVFIKIDQTLFTNNKKVRY